jgi:hypothetical protein
VGSVTNSLSVTPTRAGPSGEDAAECSQWLVESAPDANAEQGGAAELAGDDAGERVQ